MRMTVLESAMALFGENAPGAIYEEGSYKACVAKISAIHNRFDVAEVLAFGQ
jgi:hypothetical protein